MKYHELDIHSNKNGRRVGRGISAGQGKTAGRGTKGQKSRTGSKRKPGFEGGSNPLLQRLPKLPGFTSHRPPTYTVYTGQINSLSSKVVTNEALAKVGLVENGYSKVKLVVKGDITKALDVKLQLASIPAVRMLEKAGGTFAKTAQIGRPKKKDAKSE
jgi:large subunit ribosomal protein L15